MRHEGQGERGARSVSLLISVLVRYPEVGTVKYDPRRQTIRMGLLINGELTEAAFAVIQGSLLDTLEVYRRFGQEGPFLCEVEAENYGELTAVSITRDVATLRPEEIFVILEFCREQLGGRLITEYVDYAAEDEMAAQDEMIQDVLADLQSRRSGKNLIAIREDGRVMVFQK